jgi:hypothetical protein
MVKWWAGSDIWAMAIVDVDPPEDTTHPTLLEIQEVLEEFQDVFKTPEGLPPKKGVRSSYSYSA